MVFNLDDVRIIKRMNDQTPNHWKIEINTERRKSFEWETHSYIFSDATNAFSSAIHRQTETKPT